jgi:large subunit ribosomal protein L23
MSGRRYLKHNKVSAERAYSILLSPVVTEKSTLVSQHSQFVFNIDSSATKYEVAKAVEMIFKVNVVNVNVLNRPGKVNRFRGRLGKRADQKRAFVRLAQGQTIDMGAGL